MTAAACSEHPATDSTLVSQPTSAEAETYPSRLRYGALLTLMALSFLLVTAEFLPRGVLTEMAATLGVSAGAAGQTVTVTALIGFVVAPTIGLLLPRLDRRTLLVGLSVAAGVSSVIVALSPNLVAVLIARLLLGAALSAFWAMSITVAARLAPEGQIGRATMFTSGGVSLATVAGVPVGVILSESFDWRITFGLIGVITVLLAIPLRAVLPRVPAARASSLRILASTLARPGIGLGLAGHMLFVLGHFLAYTYVRVALERMPQLDAAAIVVLLGVFGAGGLAGTLLIGHIVDHRFALLSVLAPLVIAGAIASLTVGTWPALTLGAIIFCWGFFFSSWLLIVNTWAAHRTPDRLEAGGSLVVAGFQGSIALAAGLGGILVDGFGVVTAQLTGVVLLVIGAVMFGVSNRLVSVGASAGVSAADGAAAETSDDRG